VKQRAALRKPKRWQRLPSISPVASVSLTAGIDDEAPTMVSVQPRFIEFSNY
jgi:hypothetical protein